MAKTLINAIQVREFCALRDEAEREKEPWTTRNAVGLVSYNMVHQYSTCSFKRTLTLSWQFIFISALIVLGLQTPKVKGLAIVGPNTVFSPGSVVRQTFWNLHATPCPVGR